MKRIATRLFLTAALIVTASNASATLMYTDSFPSPATTRFTLMTNFWNDGDFLEQLFTGTGLSEVNEFSLDLSVTDNSLGGDTQDMDAFLNGVVIGSFMVNAGDTLLNLNFTGLNVAGMGVGGDDYLVRLETTRTVISGAGSANFSNGSQNLTLQQNMMVPEPATALLMALGIAGLGYRRRV